MLVPPPQVAAAAQCRLAERRVPEARVEHIAYLKASQKTVRSQWKAVKREVEGQGKAAKREVEGRGKAAKREVEGRGKAAKVKWRVKERQ